MTEEQARTLLREYANEKQTAFSFLNNVRETDDTTKVGNVDKDELGRSKLPVRTYKELELFCNDVGDMSTFGEFFKKMSEIQLATGLSKDALLVKLAVTQKRELKDLTPKEKKNSGWFKKEEKEEQI